MLVVPKVKRTKKWPWSVAAVAVLFVIVINTSTGPDAPATIIGEHVPASVKAVPADTVDPAPGPPAAPISYQGQGDEVLNLEKPVGVAVLDFECLQCSGNTALKTDGREALLVNEIGGYSGRHLIDVSETARTSVLTITANGSWKVTVTPGLSAVRITDGARITGTGDDVVAINGATTRALIKNRGESNFAVWIVGGDTTELAVNEIGSYEGTVPLRAPAVAIVTSSGDWSIAPF
ncbi:hypothetical protein ACQPZQ_12395 [Pseudonocardia sp. CA-142604]|uniref:hypothetical protein n=1 Tax=Pseudonocardia sp. CA-142604 TaxID=3240024 RepID=UPI003D8F96AA